MDIVDTHAHVYAPDEERYPPIEEPLRPPGGKGSLEDLRAEIQSNGVSAACIIQTSSFYRFDNRYILDCSQGRAGMDGRRLHARPRQSAISRRSRRLRARLRNQGDPF